MDTRMGTHVCVHPSTWVHWHKPYMCTHELTCMHHTCVYLHAQTPVHRPCTCTHGLPCTHITHVYTHDHMHNPCTHAPAHIPCSCMHGLTCSHTALGTIMHDENQNDHIVAVIFKSRNFKISSPTGRSPGEGVCRNRGNEKKRGRFLLPTGPAPWGFMFCSMHEEHAHFCC